MAWVKYIQIQSRTSNVPWWVLRDVWCGVLYVLLTIDDSGREKFSSNLSSYFNQMELSLFNIIHAVQVICIINSMQVYVRWVLLLIFTRWILSKFKSYNHCTTTNDSNLYSLPMNTNYTIFCTLVDHIWFCLFNFCSSFYWKKEKLKSTSFDFYFVALAPDYKYVWRIHAPFIPIIYNTNSGKGR